jgi:hypothetical protein
MLYLCAVVIKMENQEQNRCEHVERQNEEQPQILPLIPCYKDVPVFVIRNNLKTGGISRGEYFSLLAKIK